MTRLLDASAAVPQTAPTTVVSAAPAAPRLSIVIVNYRQWENTAELVRQIRAAPAARDGEVEVVVIDNHSPPHRLRETLQTWPGVSLRVSDRNLGFARAVNDGCKASRGEWFLLLNPDVSVMPGFIQGALALAGHLSPSRLGIAGFQIRHTDGSHQPSAGPFPTLFRTLAGLLLPRAQRKYRHRTRSHRCRVDWVTGCCLLLRRDCWQEIGGLDEEFFLYYEDVDLCRRARNRGWETCFEPNLWATHHTPLHTRRVAPAIRLCTRHALLTYSSRYWPRWQFRLLASIVCLEAGVRRLWALVRGQKAAGEVFRDMAALARDLAHGRKQQARQRLERVVRDSL
jgi:N-acetylglucosaminyl-diphospho-decaprenol L-rhamnosyltransferase